jgi:hypothetical protein
MILARCRGGLSMLCASSTTAGANIKDVVGGKRKAGARERPSPRAREAAGGK